VEGPPRPALLYDRGQNPFQVARHFGGRNPQSRKTLHPYTVVTPIIFLWPITPIMRLPVDFERKPCLKAGKVEGEWVQRKLAPELEPDRTLPQFAP